jgi:hypothetical protein
MPLFTATSATLLALFVGGTIWAVLFICDRRRPFSVRTLGLTVVLAGLVSRLAFALLTPIFYAPDEQAHFNYVKHLAEHHTLPVMTGALDDPAKGYEFHQPPLYYLLMTPFFLATKAASLSLDTTGRVLRSVSIGLWLINLWFGLLLLKRLQIREGFIWVFVIAMASLLPTYTFVSSSINNDNLMATLSGGVICLLVHRTPAWKHSLMLGLLVGLALLTKKSAIIFLPAMALLSALDCLGGRDRWSSSALRLGLSIGIAVLLYAPWAFRDWQLYATLNPEFLQLTPKLWPSLLYGLGACIHNVVKSFWAVSGASNDVGYPFPLPGMALLLLCCFPLPERVLAGREWDALAAPGVRAIMFLFCFLVLLTSALTLQFGFRFGMGQGRHLFPVFWPLALLLALRLRRLPFEKLDLHTVGFWVAYSVSFVVFSLCRFP